MFITSWNFLTTFYSSPTLHQVSENTKAKIGESRTDFPFTEHLLRARCFSSINPKPQENLERRARCLHFTDEETEAENDVLGFELTCG